MATSTTSDSEAGNRSSSTETMQRDRNVADNGASASHRTSEQDVANRLQHDVDQGRVRGGKCGAPTATSHHGSRMSNSEQGVWRHAHGPDRG